MDNDLTRRHGDDPSIPVLTERLEGVEIYFEPHAETKSDVKDVEPLKPTPTPTNDDVIQAVTARLAAEYAVVLAEHLRVQLQPAIDAAAAQLAQQAVAALHDTLTERIDQALAELQHKPGAPQTPVL